MNPSGRQAPANEAPTPCAEPGRADCLQEAELLHWYMDGELDDEQMDLIARRMQACEACGIELAAYRALKAALRDPVSLRGPVQDRLRAVVLRLDNLDGTGPASVTAP